jgi:hypothetical protein
VLLLVDSLLLVRYLLCLILFSVASSAVHILELSFIDNFTGEN